MKKKAVAMALVHDLPEAVTMDIPMPAGNRYFSEAKTAAERNIIESMFGSLNPRITEHHREMNEGITPEARLVKALDRVQMMLKVLCYEEERRGILTDFWENEKNFNAYGIPEAEELFAEIKKAAGR